jgi:hypothetical protein
MDVTPSATLRETYALKSSPELQRIAESPEGQYTAEAVRVAKEILSGRPASPSEPESEPEPEATSRFSWRQIGSLAVLIYGVKQLFYTWRAIQRDPHASYEALRRAVADPWTYAVGAALVIWLCWPTKKKGGITTG